MGETPDQDPELQGILTDLDAILSDLNPSAEAAAALIAPPPAPPPTAAPPVAKPPPAAPPPAAKPAPPPPPAAKPAPAPAPKPAPISKPPPMAKPAPAPAASPPAVSKAASVSAPTPAPKSPPSPPAVSVPSAPAAAPAEGSDAASSGVPETASPDEIRRAAVFFTPPQKAKAEALVAFLEQSAVTISKKPIYLRKMAWETITEKSDVNILAGKLNSMKVVAVIAVLEGLPEAKVKDIEDTLIAAGLFFRNIPAADIQKRSMAVDLIVDVMLLGSEA